ncbi:MAG: hypothetical protein ACUVT7_01100 [Thermoplasmata archaeon]
MSSVAFTHEEALFSYSIPAWAGMNTSRITAATDEKRPTKKQSALALQNCFLVG